MAELPDICLTDTFLEALYRDSYLQSVQSQFTHQQLLDVAYEQLIGPMASVMCKARRSFFREVHDITLVADQGTYTIPKYAMWEKLHLGHLLGSNGEIGRLNRREPAEDVFYSEVTSGLPHYIRLHHKTIEITPAPSSGDITVWPTLRTYIYRRPGRLVRATDDGTGTNTGRAARVSSIASPTVTYTGLMPSDFTATSEHDFYSFDAPHLRTGTAVAALTAPSTSSQTFDPDDVALLTAGDYVCLAGESCFIPTPEELVKHLKTLTIKSLSNTQADRDAYKAALEQLAEDVATIFTQAAEPLEENPQVASLLQSPFLQAMRRTNTMVR